jgi:hypothetical protein
MVMNHPYEAYLDIETTGLSRHYDDITVVGIYLTRNVKHELIQLVGEEVTSANILSVLEKVDKVFTYNGSRFDFPFIECRLGVNLESHLSHCDLMYDCWRKNLRGGFKAVERQLGIPRQLTGIDGFEAVRLWRRYVNDGDRDALVLLLKYNEEDVKNLKILKEKLY